MIKNIDCLRVRQSRGKRVSELARLLRESVGNIDRPIDGLVEF